MGNLVPPKTYAEWVVILDMLKDKCDDENVLLAMKQGTIEWQSGVAERFSRKIVDAINQRMNMATDKFQKEMSRAGGQERVIVQALLSLRKEMRFLADAIYIDAIPQETIEHYHKLVTEQADNIQKSLEDSAKMDRTGRLASIVRNNRVNSF